MIGRNSYWQWWEFIFCARTDFARAAACLLGNILHGARKNLILERMEICFTGQGGLTAKPANFHSSIFGPADGQAFTTLDCLLFSRLVTRDERRAYFFSVYYGNLNLGIQNVNQQGFLLEKFSWCTYHQSVYYNSQDKVDLKNQSLWFLGADQTQFLEPERTGGSFLDLWGWLFSYEQNIIDGFWKISGFERIQEETGSVKKMIIEVNTWTVGKWKQSQETFRLRKWGSSYSDLSGLKFTKPSWRSKMMSEWPLRKQGQILM